MPGRGTGDAVLILRRLTGKFIAKSKIFFCISWSGKGFWLEAKGDLLKNSELKTRFFFVFLDLEKAFDWKPREVIRFALRQKGVPEYLVDGVMSLYIKVVRLPSQLTENYQVHFLGTLVSIKGLLWVHFFYHGKRRFERRCDCWFTNGDVMCIWLTFVWGIIRRGHGQVWTMQKSSERKDSENECW